METGGGGKTTLANSICNQIKDCNLISTDDFIVDTSLRKAAKYQQNENAFYTSCCKESYFLPALETIILSLSNNMDCFYLPKRSNPILLEGKASLNIIEGIGAVFLPKNENTLTIYLYCDKETELERRLERDKSKRTLEEQLRSFEIRNSQFEKNIKPLLASNDIIIKSNKDFTYSIQ